MPTVLSSGSIPYSSFQATVSLLKLSGYSLLTSSSILSTSMASIYCRSCITSSVNRSIIGCRCVSEEVCLKRSPIMKAIEGEPPQMNKGLELHWKAINGSCTTDCPPQYELDKDDPKKCRRCDGYCPKRELSMMPLYILFISESRRHSAVDDPIAFFIFLFAFRLQWF